MPRIRKAAFIGALLVPVVAGGFLTWRWPNVAYVHLPALGNPKDNRAGLRAGALESQQRYAGVLRSPSGDEALTTVIDLVRRERVALLCVERDPATCHRLLVAAELVRRSPGLGVRHL